MSFTTAGDHKDMHVQCLDCDALIGACRGASYDHCVCGRDWLTDTEPGGTCEGEWRRKEEADPGRSAYLDECGFRLRESYLGDPAPIRIMEEELVRRMGEGATLAEAVYDIVSTLQVATDNVRNRNLRKNQS